MDMVLQSPQNAYTPYFFHKKTNFIFLLNNQEYIMSIKKWLGQESEGKKESVGFTTENIL